MKKPTVVVALGGNALLRRGEPLEADIQRKNIATAAKTIARIAEEAYADPELVKTAPHNQAIRQIKGQVLDDPAKWAMTWRAYLRKHRGIEPAAPAKAKPKPKRKAPT